MTTKPEVSDKRQAQLREAQRRRREKLAAGVKHQVNIYLTQEAIKSLDRACLEDGLDRHQLVENLISLHLAVKA